MKMTTESGKKDDKQRQGVMQSITYHMDIEDCICQPYNNSIEQRVHCSIKQIEQSNSNKWCKISHTNLNLHTDKLHMHTNTTRTYLI